MAKSVVTYREKGFWVTDTFLECLYCEMLATNMSYSQKLQEDLEIGISGFSHGAIDLNLDDYCDEDKNDIIQSINKVLSKINMSESEKSRIERYNTIRNRFFDDSKGYFNSHENICDTDSVRMTGEYMVSLMKGEWKHSPKDKVTYWKEKPKKKKKKRGGVFHAVGEFFVSIFEAWPF